MGSISGEGDDAAVGVEGESPPAGPGAQFGEAALQGLGVHVVGGGRVGGSVHGPPHLQIHKSSQFTQQQSIHRQHYQTHEWQCIASREICVQLVYCTLHAYTDGWMEMVKCRWFIAISRKDLWIAAANDGLLPRALTWPTITLTTASRPYVHTYAHTCTYSAGGR